MTGTLIMSTSTASSPPLGAIQLGWHTDTSSALGFATDRPPAAPSSDQPLYLEDEGHLFTVAPTGKGKGRSNIIPTLLTYPGSVLVVDPKGEAAATTRRQRSAFGDVVLLDPYELVTDEPDRFNPTDVCAISSGSTVENALMLTELLRPDFTGSLHDPFWDNWADTILSGCLAYLIEHAEAGDCHFAALREMLMSDDETYNLAVLLDKTENIHPYARDAIAQYLQLPSDRTRPSVLATAQQHLRLFGDPAVAASVTDTTFDVEAFTRGDPITIYLVLPPAKLRSHAVLLRIWVASLLTLIVERARRPTLETLFVVDEAAQLGTLESFRTATSLLRGYGLRVWSFWQDLSQVKLLYPNDWPTMINNAAVFQAFGVANWKMATEIAEIVGHLSPDQLLGLAVDQQLIARPGGEVHLCRKLDYLSDPPYQGLYDPNPMFDSPSPDVPHR